ncbi:MAG: sigma-70 family RNA polymerase sigma factor [Bacteroidota bacterium]
MAGKNDEILIEGIKKQNEKVIAEIYNLFFPSVRQFIYRNNGSLDDARDIFNDAIVVVLLKARENTLDLKCSFKTYIYAICRNLWLKKIKSEKVDMISYEEIEDTIYSAELIEEELYNISRAHLLYQKHLVRMSSACQKLLESFLDGKSFREITEEMNFENESYARKRKYRCVKLLIKRIKSDPDYNTIYHDDKNE